MTVYAITDTKKGRTGIAPTYLQTTPAEKYCGDYLWMWWVNAEVQICNNVQLMHLTVSSSSSVSWKRPSCANFQQSIVIQIEKSFILCIKIHIYTFLFLVNRYIGLYISKVMDDLIDSAHASHTIALCEIITRGPSHTVGTSSTLLIGNYHLRRIALRSAPVACTKAVKHSLMQRLHPRECSRFSWRAIKHHTRQLSHVT